jgi:predicted CopG family antitoxin
MISISITPEAYETIKTTTPRMDGAAASKRPNGQVQIWLDRAVVDRLRAMRGPGESYSDVIIRLAEEGNGSAE